MPMEDTYGIQSRIGSIIVVERWYCCRGSPVFSDRNIQNVKFLCPFEHTVDRFLGDTAAVSDALLTKTQACQTQDLSVLGHMSNLLRIIYAMIAHTIILRHRVYGFHSRNHGFLTSRMAVSKTPDTGVTEPGIFIV